MSERILFSLDNCPAGIIPPVLFLIIDGEPTDEYLPHMAKLWNNHFFKKSNKFAIGLGDGFSTDVLTLFTKNQKQVFTISDDELVCWFYVFIKRRVNLFLSFGYLGASY